MINRELKNTIEMINTIYVNKYISEEAQYKDGKDGELTKIIKPKETINIISPMKSGKTYFTFNDLPKILNKTFKEEIQLIFIAPKVSMIIELTKKYPRSIQCYEGKSVSLNGNIIISTPDSLYKAIAACRNANKKYYLAYDEVHEAFLNCKFRPALQIPFTYKEDPLYCGLMGLTATPDNILTLGMFDKMIRIEPMTKFIQSNELTILSVEKFGIETIVTLGDKLRRKNKKPLVLRINSKEKIRAVEQELTKRGHKVKIWTREETQKENDNSKLFLDCLKGLSVEFDILLTTSLVDVGVEIHLKEKPIIVDFLEYSTIIDTIQFIGRFREGVENVFLVNEKREPLEHQALNYIRNRMLNYAKDVCKVMNKHYKNDLFKEYKKNYLKLKDREKGNYEYEVDQNSIFVNSFREYTERIMSDNNLLIEYLKSHMTLNIPNITAIPLTESYFYNIDTSQYKTDTEALKEEKVKLIRTIEFEDSMIENFMMKKDDEIGSEYCGAREIWKEEYELLHSELFTPVRAEIYTFALDYGIAKAYRLVLTGEHEEIKWEQRALEAIRKYDTVHSVPIKYDSMEYKLTYYGVEEIKKNNNGNERKYNLGERNLNKIAKEVQKIKGLSKASTKALEKLFNRRYVLDKQNRISSIKKYN